VRPHARAVVCACLLPAALLVVDPAGYSPFGPSKWAAITVVGLLAVAATIFSGRLRVARWPLVWWLACLAWVVVAAAVGLDPVYAWIGTPQRHFGVFTWVLCALLFFAGQSLDDEGDARLVVGAGVAAGGFAGAWALAEEFGWQPTGAAAGSRLIGSMGSAAYLGAAMVLILPMTLGVALDRSWDRRYRVAAGGGAALAAVALIGSGARAAWVGTLLAAAVVVVVHRRRVRARVRARPAAAAAGAAVLIGAVIGLGVVTGVAGRVPALFHPGGGGGSSRVDEWAVAVKVVAHHPVTGVGPEGYRIALPEGLDAHYVETYGLSPLPDRAHDSLLDVATTTGLPGVALYVLLLGAVAVFVLRALRRGPPWLIGAAVGLVAYGAQGLALFPLAELEPAAWLLAGLVVAQTVTSRDRGHTPELVSLRPPRPAGVLVAALVVVAAVAGGRDVAADRATRNALTALANGNDPVAQHQAARAVALRPDQIEYRLAAEQADEAPDTPGAIDQGLRQIDDALAISPRDPMLTDARGSLLLERALRSGTPEDLAAARSALAQLVAGDPFDAEDQLRLGVAAAQAADFGAAEAAWRTANGLAPTSASAATDLATLYAGQNRWPAAAAAARQALARQPSDAAAGAILNESAGHLGT